ncbi:MAG TPA: hypothetical protein VGM33_26740 [Baekduia sp.]|jgi:hypothetical protein
MASSGKKKTTMAKMNRENRVRERRADKAAKKDARKQWAIDHPDGAAGEPLPDEPLEELYVVSRPVQGVLPDDARALSVDPGATL